MQPDNVPFFTRFNTFKILVILAFASELFFSFFPDAYEAFYYSNLLGILQITCDFMTLGTDAALIGLSYQTAKLEQTMDAIPPCKLYALFLCALLSCTLRILQLFLKVLNTSEQSDLEKILGLSLFGANICALVLRAGT